MPLLYYATNKLLDHVNGRTSFTMPTVYVGLFTTLPALAGTGGTEMSGGSYARVALSGSIGAAASGSSASSANIDITCNAGTVVGFGFFDASSGGNILLADDLLQAITSEANTFATSGEGTEVITLAQSDVRNVVVKDNSEVTTYTEGTDYYVQYESGKVVRISTGSIGSGATVKVTYDYPATRTVLAGDILRLSSGTLKNALIGWK